MQEFLSGYLIAVAIMRVDPPVPLITRTHNHDKRLDVLRDEQLSPRSPQLNDTSGFAVPKRWSCLGPRVPQALPGVLESIFIPVRHILLCES
jgi:hypothetical protein